MTYAFETLNKEKRNVIVMNGLLHSTWENNKLPVMQIFKFIYEFS